VPDETRLALLEYRLNRLEHEIVALEATVTHIDQTMATQEGIAEAAELARKVADEGTTRRYFKWQTWAQTVAVILTVLIARHLL
jgi:hypothetical protein